jgi:hypothetical protein
MSQGVAVGITSEEVLVSYPLVQDWMFILEEREEREKQDAASS